LGVTGSTLVTGFGRHDPRLVDSLVYLTRWDAHNSPFSPTETINERIKKKKKMVQSSKSSSYNNLCICLQMDITLSLYL